MSQRSPLPDSLELLRRARAGDARAFSQILERYQDRLLARIRLMMGPEARKAAESDDFLQDVLAEVVACFDRLELKDDRHLFHWMVTVARNNIRDSVRKKREQVFASLSITISATLDAGGREPSPETAADANEQLHRLAEVLESMSDEYRAIIELRDFDGLSFGEIGARLNRSADAAQMLHTRAMVRLGRLLARGAEPGREPPGPNHG